jgi:hypothetical protein
MGKQEGIEKFFITNLGEDQAILGYLWIEHTLIHHSTGKIRSSKETLRSNLRLSTTSTPTHKQSKVSFTQLAER